MQRRRVLALAVLVLGGLVAAGLAAAGTTGPAKAPAPAAAASGCQLSSARGDIEHVIYIIFDNVHFLRDNPNVPSDLEQMPHLLSFMRDNGTFNTNDHTVLISHTANGILTNLTGMYSDRHGQAVSNSYRYFRADGSTASSTSFKYWTDLVDDVNSPPTDPLPNMVNADSGTPKIAPAPWVPYTRAGCDFGATALANVVLENTGTGPAGDMTKVFGSGSPEWLEAQASNAAPPGTPTRNLAQTDFVGIAVHCAKTPGNICTGNANAKSDLLPDEPGGYDGFKGLFGAKYVNPAITGGAAAVRKLNGQPVTDQFGQPGFPGFDGLFATTTLGYVAQMQEAGIPVTFGYISDTHDQHGVAGEIHATRGPGEADYVQQLRDYDAAFAAFFQRLADDGIDKSNTLFVFTVEEGDHFVGSQPTNPGCDGVNVPCTYSLVGEVNGNLAGLLATQEGVTTPFTVHSDMAPTIYLTGNPSRTAPTTRAFGRALGRLSAVNPYTGQPENLSVALADPVGMKALHMITADPQRTPTLTMFAAPDWFLFAGAPNCNAPCVTVPTTPPTSTFAWNHGGIQPEIAATWLGMVGPGVRRLGDDETWVDHTDVRPTMLSLLGLEDTYVHDGRVLIDQLDASAVPQTLRAHRETLRRLGEVYKQLNAPFGAFSSSLLIASTRAVKSGSATDDATYANLESTISGLTNERDALAKQIRAALDDAAFANEALNEQQAKDYIDEAEKLIARAAEVAAG
jgi:outer membrane murein-binding lipoprotein Lpp